MASSSARRCREIGSVEGQVTVQQYCPTTMTTPGVITLSASSARTRCGGSTFIAAVVKDVNGTLVPDGTAVNFIATSGTVSPARATTVGGALNIVYTAEDGVSGTGKVSAAGGASFGSIDMPIDCDVQLLPPTTIGSGGSGGGTGSSVCVNGAVCIRPPNTGDAGLR